MVDVAPFRALRYDAAVAGTAVSTSAPAYDDVGRFTYARHRVASPYTVLELLAPSGAGESAYHGAGATFQRWRRTGVLRSDPRPAFYLYEQHELRHGVPAVLRGMLAAVRVGDPSVLPHEAIDAERVVARLQRLRAVPADLAPVVGMYRQAPPALRKLLERPPSHPPVVAMTDEDGRDHRIWALADPADIATIHSAVSEVRVVIADGHHRYAAARSLHDADPAVDRTLMFLVDAAHDGPQLLPVHRLVTGLPTDVGDRLEREFLVHEMPQGLTALQRRLRSSRDRAFGLVLRGGRFRLLTARDDAGLRRRLPPRAPVWQDLDTAVLEHAVLPPLSASLKTYRVDAAAAVAELEGSADAGLFLLRPVPLRAVFACASAGESMPPKTTWFRPKPRAGLILRELRATPGLGPQERMASEPAGATTHEAGADGQS